MNPRILVIGAGRSSTSLIRYLIEQAGPLNWRIAVGDMDVDLAASKTKGSPHAEPFVLNALNDDDRSRAIEAADFVISMLPARFHTLVVKDCIRFRKPVITPSYLSDELRAMESEIDAAGIPVLNEMGLDPGIDHMSAMKVIDTVRNSGGAMLRFESFTGGLVAPESDDNPWNYKFTWNPRNVVLAGQGGTARFRQEGQYKYIPYHELFQRVKPIQVGNHGLFEGYANRDSLGYQQVYGLEDIPTIYRGTLRKAGYSEAWNIFVRLGLTDDSFVLDHLEGMNWRDFLNAFMVFDPDRSVEDKLQMRYGVSDEVMKKLEWLGLFSEQPVGLSSGSPAQVLQHLLEQKWSLAPQDKDMIVMWHRFGFKLEGEEQELHSYMVTIGDDPLETAMSQTVGLPVGIACKLFLTGALQQKGLLLPVKPEIYNPVLAELEAHGIVFHEERVA